MELAHYNRIFQRPYCSGAIERGNAVSQSMLEEVSIGIEVYSVVDFTICRRAVGFGRRFSHS